MTPEQLARRQRMPFTTEMLEYTRTTFPGSTPEVVWAEENGVKFKERGPEGVTAVIQYRKEPKGREIAKPKQGDLIV